MDLFLDDQNSTFMVQSKEELKKWSLFDIVGICSSGVKMTLKAIKAQMETTVKM